MRFSKAAVQQYMNAKMIERAFEEDRKRLQSGYRVFVSYASIDEALAQSICAILSENGIEHFFDRKDIQWGQEVTQGVAIGLRNCTHLIVVVSPASLKSSWVAFEIGQAAALGKTILPFLQHPALDAPAFIRQYHYKTDINEIRDFFRTPPIDPAELEKLYGIIMSRLPDLENYSHCVEESAAERDVWRTNTTMHSYWGGDALHGRITITHSGVNTRVTIDAYRAQRDNHAQWHDFYDISYSAEKQSIEAEGQCVILDSEGKTHQSDHEWAASPAFWTNIVELLRSRLPAKEADGTGIRR